jgi:hypothetical protein
VEALRRWKNKEGLRATYPKHQKVVEALMRVLNKKCSHRFRCKLSGYQSIMATNGYSRCESKPSWQEQDIAVTTSQLELQKSVQGSRSLDGPTAPSSC